ncbi:conserved hypothetical protein [Ricinus communis]|uniref:Disease resistance R13L4/SHOC-2-like LRR domain-containing protein n=1 Tax=Ricinus communis TaxID=3988 RepID=B9SLI8_RICCO|nr:conserved hypothetical protein [Ricinus communis]|eukprot:XP_002526857.1 disease resistance RPP13-like protein 4 [Ricinus communis]
MSSPIDGVAFAESSSANDALTTSHITDSIQILISLFSTAKALITSSLPTASSTTATISQDNNHASSSSNTNIEYQQWPDQMTKWVADLIYIRNASGNLQDLLLKVRMQFDALRQQGQKLNLDLGILMQNPNSISALRAKEIQTNVLTVTEIIMRLKHHIPYPQKMNLGSHGNGVRSVRNVRDLFDVLLQLEAYQQFRGWSALEYFEETFERLTPSYQHCLLCFSVFPEGAVVSKRMLMYWWVGEGFIFPAVNNYDDTADEILSIFFKKDYIQPVIEQQRLVGFRMHALIRFAVVFLAEKLGFFNFNSTWNPTGDFLSCGRAIMVENAEGNSRDIIMSLNPEKLITLFNISDRFPDFKVKWFLKMRNVKVLCLGRCADPTSHIEVEDTKFLKGLKNMRHLTSLSLQGVSRIERLPNDVTKLINLRTLDLKACHNLEALPDSIGSLRNLTHLDISECYLLDRMPKGIELLWQLQVLKGFVVTDKKMKGAGSLSDLSRLSYLRKLSISTTKRDFPTAKELDALQDCKSLQKLTIIWAGTSDAKQLTRPSALKGLSRSNAFGRKNDQLNRALTLVNEESIMALSPKLPKTLEKLDLQFFPGTEAPSWLMPSKLKYLEKLYISGGNLQGLNQAEDEGHKWNVKILCLKSLPELSMHWKELQDAFPKLVYLEKDNCPNLTFFPCEENGVWQNRKLLALLSQVYRYEEYRLGLRWSFLLTKPSFEFD